MNQAPKRPDPPGEKLTALAIGQQLDQLRNHLDGFAQCANDNPKTYAAMREQLADLRSLHAHIGRTLGSIETTLRTHRLASQLHCVEGVVYIGKPLADKPEAAVAGLRGTLASIGSSGQCRVQFDGHGQHTLPVADVLATY